LGSNHLKRRLIKEGLLVNRCSECDSLPEWRGKPLTMVLDHRNGDNTDNRLENLRLLCPNCNSQQATFAGRNRGRYRLV
jgi:Zn finger protein HypA/HybF involved in hydrogenase expression